MYKFMYRVRMLKDELVSQSFYMFAATIHAYASKDGQHVSHDGFVMLIMHRTIKLHGKTFFPTSQQSFRNVIPN